MEHALTRRRRIHTECTRGESVAPRCASLAWQGSSEPDNKGGLTLLLQFLHRSCGLELRRERLDRFQGLRERFARLLFAPGACQDLASTRQPALLARRLVDNPVESRKSRIVAAQF